MNSENSQNNYPIAKAVPQRDMLSEEDYPIAEAVPQNDMSEYETYEGIPPQYLFGAVIVGGLVFSAVVSGGVYSAMVSLGYLAKKLGYIKSGDDIWREMKENEKRKRQ